MTASRAPSAPAEAPPDDRHWADVPTETAPQDSASREEGLVKDAPRDDAPPETARKIRIVIADDHRMLRQALAGLLRLEADFEVIGEAVDGNAALQICRQLRPDVALIDISMPGLDGIEVTRRLSRDLPEVRVVGLSVYRESEISEAILAAGACSYVTKGGPADMLVAAIRSCATERSPATPGAPAPGTAAPGTAAPGNATPGNATPGTAAPGAATPGAPVTQAASSTPMESDPRAE